MNSRFVSKFLMIFGLTLCLVPGAFADPRCEDRTEDGMRLHFDAGANRFSLQLNVDDASEKTDLLEALAIVAESRGFSIEPVAAWKPSRGSAPVVTLDLAFDPKALPVGDLGAPRDVDAYKEGVLRRLEAIRGTKLTCRILSAEAVLMPRPRFGATN